MWGGGGEGGEETDDGQRPTARLRSAADRHPVQVQAESESRDARHRASRSRDISACPPRAKETTGDGAGRHAAATRGGEQLDVERREGGLCFRRVFILGEGDTPRLRPSIRMSVCVDYVWFVICVSCVCLSASCVMTCVRGVSCAFLARELVIRPVPPDGSRPPPPQPLPNPLSKAYTVTPSTPPCWLCARMWCGGGGAVVARRLARARDPRKPTK